MESSIIGYNRLESSLESLAMATNLTITLPGETVNWYGRHSPYQSHQKVEVNPGHDIDEMVVIENDHCSIAVILGGDFEVEGGAL